MEHAVPEQFWVDKSQYSYIDEVQNPTKTDCPQGISAIRAIAIAQAEGQRIYTINQQSAAAALSKLPLGGNVGAEIRAAVQAGKEVTVHERAISASGWTGYGYIITDPETGAGGYLIEGKGSGGWLLILFAITLLTLALFLTAKLFLAGFITSFGLILGVAGFIFGYLQLLDGIKNAKNDEDINRVAAFAALKGVASMLLGGLGAVFYSAQISLGFLNSMLPFTMMNFGLFFYAGWFFL